MRGPGCAVGAVSAVAAATIHRNMSEHSPILRRTAHISSGMTFAFQQIRQHAVEHTRPCGYSAGDRLQHSSPAAGMTRGSAAAVADARF